MKHTKKSFENVAYVFDGVNDRTAVRLLLCLGYDVFNKEGILKDGGCGYEALLCSDIEGADLARGRVFGRQRVEGLGRLVNYLFTEEKSPAEKRLDDIIEQIDNLQKEAKTLKGEIK